MRLGVTSSFESRHTAKALRPISKMIDELEHAFEAVPVTSRKFNGVLLSFRTMPKECIEIVPNRDRIFHVCVGYDVDTPKEGLPAMFLRLVGEHARKAIGLCPIPDGDKQLLTDTVVAWEAKLREGELG